MISRKKTDKPKKYVVDFDGALYAGLLMCNILCLSRIGKSATEMLFAHLEDIQANKLYSYVYTLEDCVRRWRIANLLITLKTFAFVRSRSMLHAYDKEVAPRSAPLTFEHGWPISESSFDTSFVSI